MPTLCAFPAFFGEERAHPPFQPCRLQPGSSSGCKLFGKRTLHALTSAFHLRVFMSECACYTIAAPFAVEFSTWTFEFFLHCRFPQYHVPDNNTPKRQDSIATNSTEVT
jgi:hypothetical protein